MTPKKQQMDSLNKVQKAKVLLMMLEDQKLLKEIRLKEQLERKKEVIKKVIQLAQKARKWKMEQTNKLTPPKNQTDLF